MSEPNGLKSAARRQVSASLASPLSARRRPRLKFASALSGSARSARRSASSAFSGSPRRAWTTDRLTRAGTIAGESLRAAS